MISPAEQKIIQIDITNACPHKCSNCTRFVGHHKKSYFMSVDDFKIAYASLKEFKGMIGVMGGEPTIHPKFKEIVDILPKLGDPDNTPVRDFSEYRKKNLANVNKRLGLWTSLGLGYYKHFEQIQDTFPYQCINDHAHNGEHISLLMPYSDLGFTKEEFIKYRDKCWVQNLWSACINPKGAFFCEVAASMAMLFDGDKGWDVEPGWWKRQPKDFGKQLEWCEICSACLPVPRVTAKLGVDSVTKSIYDKLIAMGSKKEMKILNIDKYKRENFKVINSFEPYLPMENNAARIASTNNSLKPKNIDVIIVCENYPDYLDATLSFNVNTVKGVGSIHVISSETDTATKKVCEKYGVGFYTSKRLHEHKAKFAKGKAINDLLDQVKPVDWVLHIDADVILPFGFSKIKDYVLNPGVLYYTRRWGASKIKDVPVFLKLLGKIPVEDLKKKFCFPREAKVEGRIANDIEFLPFGYFQLFNINALSLKNRERIYPEKSETAEYDDKVFGFDLFPKNKVKPLPVPEFEVIHLPHGMYKENWEGRVSPNINKLDNFIEGKYECVNKCQFAGKLRKPGDIIIVSDYSELVSSKFFRRVK